MNYNTDGFDERSIYIHNSNDSNKLENMGPSNLDSSFSKMKSEERKDIVSTTNTDEVILVPEATGNKENFVKRNNAMMNANAQPTQNNPINRAMNRNMFNPFKK